MKVKTLETIFETFNQAKVRYIVAGGIAVNIHGYQRMATDLAIAFNVVSLSTLITMKETAGRAKDIDDIEHLKMIQENINER